MRILTNPGSNLPAACLAYYDILMAPLHIQVDQTMHDTRRSISLSQIDTWVAHAKSHPKTHSTTSTEFFGSFLEALAQDPELLCVLPSRKLGTGFVSAQAAVRSIQQRVSLRHTQVAIVDSRVTDLGTGLLTLLAADAARANVPLRDLAKGLDALAEEGHMVLYAHQISNLWKSGRADFLKAWMAQLLDLRPLLGSVDGDVRMIGRVKLPADPVPLMVERLRHALTPTRRVWVAIAHGNSPDQARSLERELRATFQVELAWVRPFSASVYLHTGPGALAVSVFPIDVLPWTPSIPPAVVLDDPPHVHAGAAREPIELVQRPR